MSKCPLCKKDISYLLNQQSGMMTWEMRKGEEYDNNVFKEDNEINEWLCPECEGVVATNGEEADKILQ